MSSKGVPTIGTLCIASCSSSSSGSPAHTSVRSSRRIAAFGGPAPAGMRKAQLKSNGVKCVVGTRQSVSPASNSAESTSLSSGVIPSSSSAIPSQSVSTVTIEPESVSTSITCPFSAHIHCPSVRS
jgi:hypothetical protein